MQSPRDKISQRALYTIVGPGAVGACIAGILTSADIHVRFLGRFGPATLEGRFERDGRTSAFSFPKPSDYELSQTRLAFFAVKVYDLFNAVKQHVPNLPEGIAIVILSNGAVAADLQSLRRKWPAFLWRIGVILFGATVAQSGAVVLRSRVPKIIFGPLDPAEGTITPAEEFALKFDSQSPFRWSLDSLFLARKKWLFNLCINSIAAANRLGSNGEVSQEEYGLWDVFREGYSLGEELWGEWRDAEERLFKELCSLVQDTSENENSMARDVRLHRRTEKEYFTGLAIGREGYPRLKSLHYSIPD